MKLGMPLELRYVHIQYISLAGSNEDLTVNSNQLLCSFHLTWPMNIEECSHGPFLFDPGFNVVDLAIFRNYVNFNATKFICANKIQQQSKFIALIMV